MFSLFFLTYLILFYYRTCCISKDHSFYYINTSLLIIQFLFLFSHLHIISMFKQLRLLFASNFYCIHSLYNIFVDYYCMTIFVCIFIFTFYLLLLAFIYFLLIIFSKVQTFIILSHFFYIFPRKKIYFKLQIIMISCDIFLCKLFLQFINLFLLQAAGNSYMPLNKQRSSIILPNLNQQSQYESNQDSLPWLCHFCGINKQENNALQQTHLKQKVNLSKIRKHKRNENTPGSGSIESEISYLNVNKMRDDESDKNLRYSKIPRQSFPINSQRGSVIKQMKNELKNSSILPGTNLNSNNQNNQLHQKYEIRFSYGSEPFNRSIELRNDPFCIKQQKNNYFIKSNNSNINSSLNTTDTSKFSIQSAQTTRFNNIREKNNQLEGFDKNLNEYTLKNSQLLNQNSQPKILIHNQNSHYLTFKNKQQKLQSISKTNDPSTFSTQQQIPLPLNFKNTISLNEPDQLILNKNHKKSSKNYANTKFMMNMKKVSSRSENSSNTLNKSLNLSDKNSSNYTHFGNKIKIGIRKVESFESQPQQDEISEVLSHGQRSFLMPEINEVSQMSRISSRSSFKNWEDDQNEVK